jgi:hypothetical protein
MVVDPFNHSFIRSMGGNYLNVDPIQIERTLVG